MRMIADTYGLTVIDHAVDAFAVKYKGKTLLQHGDLSVLSFHATTVFNTFGRRPGRARLVNARAAAGSVICLPLYPAMSDEDRTRIAVAIAQPR